MRTIEQAIMTRLTSDVSGSSSLQTLLGGSGRIAHGGERFTPPKSPGLYYRSLANAPGSINSDNVVTSNEFYQFRIYADNFEDIAYRLRVLLDRYVFPDQSDTGNIYSVWDSDGPDLFDDAMEVQTKVVQFRIFMVPKAAASV